MSNITLSAGVRANLLSLQNTAALMAKTQNNLATGKKVNSALDNPLNFFTSQNLNSRADALSGLLDAMSNGIQTIQAANNGLTSITSLVQQLQSTVSQARGDTSVGTVTPGAKTAAANSSTSTNNTLTFDLGGGEKVSINTWQHVNATVSTITSSGAVGTADLSASSPLSINDSGTAGNVAITFASGDTTLAAKVTKINTQLGAAGSTVTASVVNGELRLTNATGKTITATATAAGQTDLGLGATTTSTDGSVAIDQALTNQQIADAINANSALAGKVTASVAAGVLTMNNLSTTTAVGVTGYNNTNVTGNSADSSTIAAGTASGTTSVRDSLKSQFNNLMTQIDKLAGDSGYNGINLLNGDKLNLSFNENNSSNISVQMTDSSGNKFAINSANLGIVAASSADFGSNTTLDTITTSITAALTTLQAQSTAISSSLSVVQTRQDFTKSMVNTLQTGANNLVLADPNQEGANLLALQTRQSLSTTALSMASQADQAVLRLFQ
jgi:flagellin